MTDNSLNLSGDVQEHWGWFAALGVVMITGGVFAFLAPFTASLVVEAIVGASFLVGGIVSLVQIFMTKDGWSARSIYFILGSFNFFAGAMLLFRPLEGLLALTLLMIIAIFVSGVMKSVVGIQSRPDKGWGWLTTSGAISIGLAIYIFTKYPEISTVLLGLFAGVSLVSDGIGYLRFAYGLESKDPTAT